MEAQLQEYLLYFIRNNLPLKLPFLFTFLNLLSLAMNDEATYFIGQFLIIKIDKQTLQEFLSSYQSIPNKQLL